MLPVEISSERINQIKSSLPELPDAKKNRYMSEYNLKNDDAEILSLNTSLSNYFENSIKGLEKGFQVVANFILTEVTGLCNKHNINLIDSPVKPEQISKLMQYIDDGKISSKQAKDILTELWTSEYDIDEIIKNKNIEQISDEAKLREISIKILDNFPKEVQDYNNGKDKLMGFFVGQIMKETKGKANPKILNKIIVKLLEEKK